MLTALLYSSTCFLIAEVSTHVTKSSKFLSNTYNHFIYMLQEGERKIKKYNNVTLLLEMQDPL